MKEIVCYTVVNVVSARACGDPCVGVSVETDPCPWQGLECELNCGHLSCRVNM